MRHELNAAKPPKRRRRGGQFGKNVQALRFRRSDHPVRSTKGSFASSLRMSRPPLLFKEGNMLACNSFTASDALGYLLGAASRLLIRS